MVRSVYDVALDVNALALQLSLIKPKRRQLVLYAPDLR